MSTVSNGFSDRIARLKADLIAQGRRVQALTEDAFRAAAERDAGAARHVVTLDDAVDRVDVEIEQAAVAILSEATRENAELEPSQVREVLTIVKVNNELERVADLGVAIAERVAISRSLDQQIPPTVVVMGNSVVGILRDVVTALEHADAKLAKVALRSEDTLEAFKSALLRDAENQIAMDRMTPDHGFFLAGVAAQLVTIADHCSNIAEQVIYATTGAIVRHMTSGWVEIPRPGA
ncbi:MAG: hypothetical protein KF866_03280 [Phycisphaeraceae bacterium]|nr:hypothetical protein [Phycisphaeraceae bacterium]MCW5753281.1 hypothetical protein [Phycisphaeraceae bacterium]